VRIGTAASALLCVLALLTAGCGTGGGPAGEGGRAEAGAVAHAEHTGHAGHAEHAGHAGEPESGAAIAGPAALPGRSLYHLNDVWHDQTGTARPLSSLRGRPQVITMAYTHCGHACPRLLLDMKRIEAELDGAGVGFVLVSIDPVRDTPERLAHYAGATGLDPARWTLLTAPDPAVRGLAALLGVRYRPEGDGEFSHSNVITVLDAAGEIVYRQAGLGEDPGGAVRALASLLREERP
jgi:protein SCO1